MKENVKIIWHGHSCFKVVCDNYEIVFDPYEDGYVPGLKNLDLEADEVLCSHEHGDHNAVSVVKLKSSNQKNPFRIEIIDTFHDDTQGSQRGTNKIHILDNGEFRIAHFGDIGCELTDEQVKKIGHLDVAMIPIGGFYTIDAAQAKKMMDELQPHVIIPMHYRGEGFGFDVIGTLDQFTSNYNNVVEYNLNKFELDAQTKKQVAVLKLSL